MTRSMLVRVGLSGVLLAAACLSAGLKAGAAEAKKAEPKKTESKGFFGSGAEGVNTTTGTVVSTAALSVEVSAGNKNVTYYAKKTDKDLVAILGQLAPPDNVTITWNQKDGRKWIQKIEGRGTAEGFVTGRTNVGLEVTPQEGAPQRLFFPWTGQSSEEIAKLDSKSLKRMQSVKVGDQVKVAWEISDAKRVASLKIEEKGPAQKRLNAASGDSSGHSHAAAKATRRARGMSGPGGKARQGIVP